MKQEKESEQQVSVIQNYDNLFYLREKVINFFREFFLLSEAKYKAKCGKGLKILKSK